MYQQHKLPLNSWINTGSLSNIFWYSVVRGQKLSSEENQYFLPFEFLNMKPSYGLFKRGE